jgi:hypothetical protein
LKRRENTVRWPVACSYLWSGGEKLTQSSRRFVLVSSAAQDVAYWNGTEKHRYQVTRTTEPKASNMPQFSDGLMFVWSVAESEAKHSRAPEIEPVHLMLGLSKASELDEEGGPISQRKLVEDQGAGAIRQLEREASELREVMQL